MKNFILAIFLVSISYDGWSKTKLVDLLKAGKNQYYLSPQCKAFIQSSNDSTFHIPEMKKFLRKSRELPFFDDVYYHYTNAPILPKLLKEDIQNREEAQKAIIKSGGYRNILEFQMTDKNALDNVAGVGFYVAANPFSSLNYGKIQLALKISPEASVLNYSENGNEVRNLVHKIETANPQFRSCEEMVKISIALNENDVDLLYYDSGNEWFVVFNEDIITQSKVATIPVSDQQEVFKKLLNDEEYGAAFEYVRELNPNTRYPMGTMGLIIESTSKKFPTQAKAMGFLLEKMPQWNGEIKVAFLNYIAAQNSSSIDSSIELLKSQSKITDADLWSVDFSKAGQDYLKLMSQKIIANPTLVDQWGKDYHEKMLPFLKKGTLKPEFYVQRLPVEVAKDYYYAYKLSNLTSTAEIYNSIIKGFFTLRPDIFPVLSDELKVSVIRAHVSNLQENEINAFMRTLDASKIDLKESFDVLIHHALYREDNLFAFVLQYILQKNDPSLISDTFISLFPRWKDQKKAEFLSTIMKRKEFAEKSRLIKKRLIDDSSDIASLMGPGSAVSFSREEQAQILGKILYNYSPPSLVNLFQSTFNFSSTELISVLLSNPDYFQDIPVKEVLAHILKDKKEFPVFMNLENPQGVGEILKNDRFEKTRAYLITEGGLPFIKASLKKYKTNYAIGNALVIANEKNSFSDQLNVDEKIQLLEFSQFYDKKTFSKYFNSIPFTPAMANTFYQKLTNNSYRNAEVDELLSNLDFVRALTSDQILDILINADRDYYQFNIDVLIKSDALTKEKAAVILIGLEDNFPEIRSSLMQTHFQNMDEEDKKVLATVVAKHFRSCTAETWKRLKPDLLPVMKKNGSLNILVKHLNRLDSSTREEVIRHFASTEKNFLEAIPAFGNNFVQAVVNLGDLELLAKVLSYVEKNYPVQDKYPSWLIAKRDFFKELEPVLAPHFEKFLCKKVNGYHAFADVIEKEESKYSKKFYKEKRKTMCNWGGFF